MPNTKEAHLRYRVINRCLIDHKICSLELLSESCGEAMDKGPVHPDVILEDIENMIDNSELGYIAPIKFSEQKKGYYYEDENYSIDKLPINQEELNSLVFAATLLDQYKYLDLFKDLGGTVQKIKEALQVRKLVNEPEAFDYIRFDKIPTTRGGIYLPKLIQAIKEKKVVLIKYQPFYEDEPFMVQVHPYLLKEYRFRWYLIGFNEQVQQIKTYGLDRIQLVEFAELEYLEKKFDATDYFRNTIGVISPSGKVPLVKIEVRKPQSQYLITQPWHESQEVISETDDAVVFQFRVHPTFEFKSLVLSLGPDVKVILPRALQKEIASLLQEALGVYGK